MVQVTKKNILVSLTGFVQLKYKMSINSAIVYNKISFKTLPHISVLRSACLFTFKTAEKSNSTEIVLKIVPQCNR